VRTYRRLVEYRAELDAIRGRSGRVGLVTTMGALHAGHASLVRRAAEECDAVAVTIFVNPLQFGDPGDLVAYPRDLDHDLDTCRDAGATAVLVPSVQEMYPGWPRPMATSISVGALATALEGASRPGHFDGVATVVAKLFSLTGPCRAYFGEKDFQQLAVVRTMAADLSIPVDVVGCATVREADGLAMSSRNERLTPSERAAAPVLAEALAEGCRVVASGAGGPRAVVRAMTRVVDGEPLAAVVMADVIEHLTNAEEVLRVVHRQILSAVRHDADAATAPLVVSIPNVSHIDLAAKLLAGRWELGRKRIDAPLRTDTRVGGERTVRVHASGKASVSDFRPVQFFGRRGPGALRATLVEVALHTGRTHQIRVHAAYAGHPVAGDEKYGDAGFNARLRELGLERMFLHAHSMSFEWPNGGPFSASASASMTSTSWAFDGANTVMPGMDSDSTRSSTPWWLGPSSPVMPARSRTNTTRASWSPTSRLAWSKARLKNVEYTATTGRSPPMAIPAAAVTACCSAMPTSTNRSGKRSWNARSPVGPGIAAVMATIRGSASAARRRDRVNASV